MVGTKSLFVLLTGHSMIFKVMAIVLVCALYYNLSCKAWQFSSEFMSFMRDCVHHSKITGHDIQLS